MGFVHIILGFYGGSDVPEPEPIVTTRLTLIGTSQRRLALQAQSQERLTVLGQSEKRLTQGASSP